MFASFEVGADVAEGIALWLQDSSIIDGHYMDLLGSMCHGDRRHIANLGIYDGRPVLSWNWGDVADPSYGSVSRGEQASTIGAFSLFSLSFIFFHLRPSGFGGQV
jgi:hypothetical protein